MGVCLDLFRYIFKHWLFLPRFTFAFHIYIYIYIERERDGRFWWIYTHTHKYIYIFTNIYTYSYISVQTNLYTHTHSNTHTYMHIYTYVRRDKELIQKMCSEKIVFEEIRKKLLNVSQDIIKRRHFSHSECKYPLHFFKTFYLLYFNLFFLPSQLGL